MKKIQSFCFKTPPTAAGFNAQPKTKNNEKKLREFCIANEIKSTWTITMKNCAMRIEDF